ncbi:MAG: HdeD family acid-resistance protein, partial [Acetobacteraceae bacterium]
MSDTAPTPATRDDPSRNDRMSVQLAQNWWLVALRGVLGIIFGLIALFTPVAAMLTLALFFAAYLLVDGIFAIFAAIRAANKHERWGWLLGEGVINLVMGLIAAAFPGAAVLAFVIVTAIWALLSGGMMLAAAFRLHLSHGRWWLVLGGVASLIFGVLLLLAPMFGALVLTWWLGAYAIIFGVALLVLAFRLKSNRDWTPTSQTGGTPHAA